MTPENLNCLLCGFETNKINDLLNKCLNCELVFKNPSEFVDLGTEKARYETHNNDVEDEGYLNYLNKVFSNLEKPEGLILDFGCGPTKGLEALVKKRELSLSVDSYDPLFFPKIENKKYKTIFASECFEHFYDPLKTIKEVVSLLDGTLCVATQLYDDQTDWNTWWYLKDLTHVVFYSRKTFIWIANRFDLKVKICSSSVIILSSNLK